jgi:ankyrin repeat protein
MRACVAANQMMRSTVLVCLALAAGENPVPDFMVGEYGAGTSPPRKPPTPDTDKSIHLVTRRDDVESVKTLIEMAAGDEDNPDVEKIKTLISLPGKGGQSPLMAAALEGSAKSFKVLLEHGAEAVFGCAVPDAVLCSRQSPYHPAGFKGRAEIVKISKAHGLDPLDMHEGFTGMHRACAEMGFTDKDKRQDYTDTVLAFLEMGVDPEHKADDGRTCLEMTSNEATKKLVQEWVDRKATKKTDEL